MSFLLRIHLGVAYSVKDLLEWATGLDRSWRGTMMMEAYDDAGAVYPDVRLRMAAVIIFP